MSKYFNPRFVHWLAARLSEPSTWAGMIGPLVATGVMADVPGNYIAIACTVAGLVAMAVPE